jgi:hypothetical protein
MRPRARSLDDVVRQLNDRGWAPALWAHHPPEVRAAIRAAGWRPQVKQCFMNCQRLATSGLLDVEYREGWVQAMVPMQHAWLLFRGEILDLTLDPGREVEYLGSHSASPEEIRIRLLRTGYYGPVFPERIHEISPFRAAVDGTGAGA